MARSRHATMDAKTLTMDLHLIFTEEGDVRMTRSIPALARGERSMALSLQVPRSIFKTPTLQGRIVIEDSQFEARVAETICDADMALRGAGIDLKLSVLKK